jgi:hypothetical protein
MTVKETKKRLTRTLTFVDVYDDKGKHTGGGTRMPRRHMKDELWVQLTNDPVMDRTGLEGETGRLQIHLGSTRRALEEFALMLLAIAHYTPPEPGYSASLELQDQNGNPAAHLVVHLPDEEPDRRPDFSAIHNVFSGTIYEDGTLEDRTLPIKGSEN